METVWERERALGSSELRYATLQRLEGVEKIVDTHLAKALRALGSSERVMAIDMFDHLVSPSGGNIQSVLDLAHRTGHSDEQVGGVLDKLDHARVVRPVPAPPGQDARRFRRYEIFHDVLAPAINRTITAREEQRRARARLRGVAVLALGLVAIAMVVLVIALIRANSADRSTAQSRQLAAAAEANATRDPELSALLALQALRLHYTSQAETALRDALPNVQELRTFRDNTTVASAVFDPANANLAASAEKNGVTQIWDVKTGRVLFSLTPKGGFHVTGTANTVAFNHAGTKVAVGYGLSQVVLFDVGSRQQVAETNVGSSVNDVQFVGRTDELAIAARDNVRLWPRAVPLSCGGAFTDEPANTVTANPRNPLEFAVATGTGTTIWQLRSDYCPRHHRPLNAGTPSHLGDHDAEFSLDGTQVVTADFDGFVRVYDLATFQLARVLGADEGTATSASFSSDGQEIVAGYTSGAARVWDAATGLPLTGLAGDASAVNTAKFAARGSDVITASNDGTIRVWDAQPRELQAQYSFATPPYLPWPFYAAQYSAGGGRILSVDGSGSARVLTARGQPVYSGGQAVAIHPSGTYVKTARFNRAGTGNRHGQRGRVGGPMACHRIGLRADRPAVPHPGVPGRVGVLRGLQPERLPAGHSDHQRHSRGPQREHRPPAAATAESAARFPALGGQLQPERAGDPDRRQQRPGGEVERRQRPSDPARARRPRPGDHRSSVQPQRQRVRDRFQRRSRDHLERA